jgi:hypothetical protein
MPESEAGSSLQKISAAFCFCPVNVNAKDPGEVEPL